MHLWSCSRGASWVALTQGATLLNRAASAAQLEEGLGTQLCPCLNARYRESLGSSMLYHPPAIHNLWDSQLLVTALGAASRPAAGNTPPLGARAAHTRVSRAYKFELAQPLRDWCCCPPPPSENATERSLGSKMWVRVCKLRGDQLSSPEVNADD